MMVLNGRLWQGMMRRKIARDVAGGKVTDERGDLWEHDPGPSSSSGWAELFAETPNYRGLGLAVVGREAFRWHHGPIFFRGRLDGSAKVVVVGQEGAQDESLSHRSFTGGTGARMQYLLQFLGIDRSYLFLNTFVYPIFGQYTPELRPLAQDLRSPIAIHRNRIFDKAVAEGDVRLVIAVGRAAKEAVATWIEAHGGSAQPESLHVASLGSLPNRVRVVGVLHPGSAASGSTAEIKADFARAIGHVRDWLQADPGWLPPDTGVPRDLSAPFPYLSRAIPYRDFPFGTCARLGRGGTASNRSDNQRAIRLFSAAGQYNARGAHLRDPSSAEGNHEGYADDPGDLPYEAPRAHPLAFDPGPPADVARLLAGGEPGLGWPDFSALGVTSHASFGTGPIYRGRFSQISLFIVADQGSDDDTFTARALSGQAGQYFQGFLTAAGLTERYLIIRTLPVDTLDLTPAQQLALAGSPLVQALHRELLRRLQSQNTGASVVLALGPGARRLAANVAPAGVDVIELAGYGEPDFQASWQSGLTQLAGRAYTKDTADPSFAAPIARSQLPRMDLPYGMARWAGTSGDRAVRPIDTDTGRPSPDYLKLFVPAWVAELDPAPLTASEQLAAKQLS
jgi:uracil-DNA glycosylase